MKKLILTMCLTAAGVFGAAAQMRLTLGEALDLALSENPTVKVAEMEVQRFDYVKRQTWGSWIPQISVGGTYTRSIVKQSMTKGLSFGADNTLAAQRHVDALRPGGVPHAEDERRPAGRRRGVGALVADYAGRRSQKGLL